MHWVSHPLILEINTIPWLHALSKRFEDTITLKNIPEEVIDEFRNYNAIWMMGVWQRSIMSKKITQEHSGFQEEFKTALSDFSKVDIIGSPYAVKNYTVNPKVGGKSGLETFHSRLNALGKCLILDFVPNHTAIDHPWVSSKPEYYIHGDSTDLIEHPNLFTRMGTHLIAHGKDPYFPPWTDTLQLNAYSNEYREQAIRTLMDIQQHCEGVRCDMAMLLINSVFKKTWQSKVSGSPEKEFWIEVIPSVKQQNPDFKFIAEVYWNREWELIQQGFDYCYDKILYDRMLFDPARSIRGHLQADWDYSRKLVRFVENHDEKRAVGVFGIEQSLSAACIALCLPGARLIHYGQQFGFSKKLPIQLRRGAEEEENKEVKGFYDDLIPIINDYLTKSDLWKMGKVCKKDTPEGDNPIISYYWNLSEFIIYVIVNFSDQNVKCALDLSTLGQDISYDMVSLLHRNSEKLEWSLESQILELSFAPWGIQVLKLSY